MTNTDPLSNRTTDTTTGLNTGTTGSGTGNQGNQLSQAANQAKQKASEMGRTAVQKADQARESAAGALQSAADTLRDKGQGAPGKVGELASTAAQKLETTAEYMRNHDMNDMLSGLESSVRRNPGIALVAAAAFGFLLGSTLKKDRD